MVKNGEYEKYRTPSYIDKVNQSETSTGNASPSSTGNASSGSGSGEISDD